MKKMLSKILTYVFFSILSISCKSSYSLNGGFEILDEVSKTPKGWLYKPLNSANIKIDKSIKKLGNYSLLIESTSTSKILRTIENVIAVKQDGKLIELKGFVKTDKINNGFAGLMMKLEGADKILAFNNVQEQPIRGTNDWTEYSISLPYSNEVEKIRLGGVFSGSGKVWFDDFRLYIDGKLVKNIIPVQQPKALTDTSFKKGSGISQILVDQNSINNLKIIGQFWAFLKYHHPYVASGNINWDAELFKILHKTSKSNYKDLSDVLENYVDSLPKVKSCVGCNTTSNSEVLLNPDYGGLLTTGGLSKALIQKLKFIQQNADIKDNYWVKGDMIGVPRFYNEKGYEEMTYPDAGYRLLALYRYWGIINYYYPYKNLAEKNWNDVLNDFIPKFILAKNEQEYTLTTLKLIRMINDTHANIWGMNKILENIKGHYITPFQAKFIQEKLVVTGFYKDTLNIKQLVNVGDVIVSINGTKVKDLVDKYLPITPASNYDTQLRDMPTNYLLKSNNKQIRVVISKGGKDVEISIPTVNSELMYQDIDYTKPKGYYLQNEKIGYVYAGKYKNSDLPEIKKLFKTTKGIIVDLRCYPSDFMPFTFGNYIKSQNTLFSRFSRPDYSVPGKFILADSASNGVSSGDTYLGKVIVIVNSSTQSQAEYTTMAFQSSPNVKVIGSQTAGADGNVTSIILPGGISTAISGLGVFYPDGKPTQRVGVKIDYPIKPTVASIRNGRDELLEKAVELLQKGW
ncbi:MAG: S41 family peptidase [Pedobacter sp.]|uniref:S41 family peptidase n=1 Tax=Pedobacter sp. TaxID=1411316 RepID=UPI00280949A7|nr:S41 family peptidase [Pedobacter sp.]MDQ8006401.1 S41 family peptidase [Pedobacter sp.]